MPDKAQHSDDAILSPADAGRRMELLAALQTELEAAGVRCLLARKHRLVLRYNRAPLAPSGLTDPQLHIFTPGGKDTATTDGLVGPSASLGGIWVILSSSRARLGPYLPPPRAVVVVNHSGGLAVPYRRASASLGRGWQVVRRGRGRQDRAFLRIGR